MAQNKLKFDYRIKTGLRMTPQAVTNLRRLVLVASAGSSTRLGGARLTDKEVEKIMQTLTYLEEERVEDTLSPKQYEVWKYISNKGNASLGEIIEATKIVRGTVRQALLRLVELGKIKRIGRGRATRYVKI